MSNRTIEIVVDVRDATGGKLGGLKKQLESMDAAAQKLNQRIKAIGLQRYAATLRLIDKVTEPASRINNLLKRMAGAAYRITMRLNDNALAGIRKIESALMRITSKAYNIAVNVKGGAMNKLNGLMSGAAMGAGAFMPLAGAAGIGFGVANAIQASAGFEKAMSKVQAIRQLSKDSAEMKALTQQAKNLGMQTEWTRAQVAEGQYYMALAGWDTKQILKSTPHLLNLASAGGTDLGRTSDIVTDSMTAFGLSATEDYVNKQGKTVNAVEHFADMLAKLQASSNTDISQAGEAFKYSANVIGAMFSGQSVQNRMQATEDAMIMTGLMANAGIKGSMAGTSTRAIFTRMASMNRNSYQALRALGVDYQDENGNILMPGEIMRGLSRRFKEGVDPNQLLDFAETIAGEKIHADTRRKLDSFIEQTRKNGGKMSSADMAKMSAMLAGQEAMSGLLAVLMGDWDAMADKLDNVGGTAKEMSETMLDNLAGSFTKLGSAWDAFQQDLFTGTAGDSLRGLVDSLTEILTRANNLFKDGIDIGDFGKIIGDVISRLKNKFLELDGIGSLLAGGALVAGLYKVTTLAQRALGALRGVAQAKPPAAGGAGTLAGQKVGTMTVSAGVVNINGRLGGGGVGGRKVGNTAIIDNYNRTKEQIRGGGAPPPPVVSRWAGLRGAAGGAAAFAGIFSLLDIMNVKAVNAERLAAATDENRAQIIRENRQAEWEAAGGGLGAVAGAAAGAALGSLAGPMGTAIGGIVGGMIGEKLGAILGEKGAEGEVAPASRTSDVSQNQIADIIAGRKAGDAKGFEQFADFGRRQTPNNWLLNPKEGQNYFGSKGEDITHKLNMPANWKSMSELKRGAGHQGWSMERQQAEWLKENAKEDEAIAARRLASMQKENGLWRDNASAMDFYSQQMKDLQKLGQASPEILSRAEAGTPTAEQLATEGQVAMPEIIPPETSPLDEWFNFDGITERLAELGAQITEGLGAAMEGAGEIFSGLQETLGSAMEGAASAAQSSLESIQTAFTTAKEAVQSAWAELPGFFSGVFSGLGGAASAAGSAIYSGLTSVIGAVIGAWQSAASTVSSIISSIASAASSVASMIPSFGGGGGVGKAEGGFVTSLTHFFAGEHGAEAIIPLDPSKRSRAMELLAQTEAIVNGASMAFGDEEISGDTPILSSGGGSSGGGGGGDSSSEGVTINLGGFTVTVNANNAEEFVRSLESNIQEVADKIAGQLSQTVMGSFKNQNVYV